jgi:hypothetical protein
VYVSVRENPRWTWPQHFRALRVSLPAMFKKEYAVRRRGSDLKRNGYVRADGEVVCPINGTEHEIFVITDKIYTGGKLD